MSTAKVGLLGALTGLGQGMVQVGQTAYADKLAQHRAELAARLQQQRDDTQYTRQLARDETLHQRELDAESRAAAAGLEKERRDQAAAIERFEAQKRIEAEYGKVEHLDDPLLGPIERNLRTGQAKQMGRKDSTSASGGAGFEKLDDYHKAISDQFRYDWDRRKDEGRELDSESRKFLVAIGQEIGTALYQMGRALPPGTVTADTTRALDSGQFPNLSRSNAIAAAQKALATGEKTRGGYISEGGEPILPDPNDPKVQAAAYQLQEQARNQLREFMFNQYFKPDEYQQSMQAAATPEPKPKKDVDVAGLLSKIPMGTNAPTLGEEVGMSARRGIEIAGKGLGAANQFIAEEIIPNYLPLNIVKGIYQFYTDVFSPRGERAPDYFQRVDQALKKGYPIPPQDLVNTAKWVRENPGKGGLTPSERADLLAALAEMIEAQSASGQ